MAAMIYSSSYTNAAWLRPGANSVYVSTLTEANPYPEPPDQFVNKVWDPIDGKYIRWETSFMDTQGSAYPGSSAWSNVAASYCVESITYRRLES